MSDAAPRPAMSGRTEFLAGAARAIPILVSAGPFGALFGALAVDNGMTANEATLMSATVFAGASQMVGIELFGTTVAPWLIVLTIFAVNFRHVLYSAAIGRTLAFDAEWKRHLAFFFLTDPQFAETEARRAKGPVTFAWYMGMAIGLYIPWLILAWLGAHFGKLIENPVALGFDFLLPMYFFGLLLTFRSRPLWLPIMAVSAMASIAAFHTIGSPWHVTAGALAGVIAAVIMAKPDAAAQTVERGA